MGTPIDVLLIEASHEDAARLEASLSGIFTHCITRVTAQEALEAALSRNWDVILSDYHLPGFTGLDALRIARVRHPDIPFVLVAGAVGEEVATEALNAGADGFILKSNLPRLPLIIRRIVREAKEKEDRKTAQAALQESEAKYRSLFEYSPDAIFLNDPASGQIFEANATACVMLGMSEEEIILRGRSGIAEDSPALQEGLKAPQCEGSARIQELTMVRKDGTRLTVEVNTVTFAASPNTLRSLTIARDITERKQAEAALRESEEKFNTAFAHAAIGFCINEPNGRFIDANPAFCKLIGYSIDELRGSAFTGLVHPEDIDENWQLNRRMVAGEINGFVIENRFVCKDGHIAWVRKSVSLVRNTTGAPRWIVSLIEDINDRKRAEEALIKSKEFAERVMASSLNGMYIHSLTEKRHTYINPQYTTLTGYILDEVRALTREDAHALFHPDDREKALNHIDKLRHISENEVVEFEYRFKRKDGQWRWLLSKEASFLRNADNTVREFIGTFVDITEHKQAEERLRESEETFRALVDGAADAYFVHDLTGKIIEGNKMACESLGYTREELLGMSVFDVDADFKQEFATDIWSHPARGNVITVPGHHRRKDGSAFPVEVRISSIAVGGQRVLLALARDITERLKAEDAQKLAAKVYQDSSEAMMVLDEHHQIIMVNQAFANITRYEANEVIGQKPAFLRADPHDDIFYKDMWERVRATGRFKGETWHKRKGGQLFAVQIVVNAISDGSHLPNRYVSLLSDITEKKRSEDLIWSQANFDSLTGLPNRRFFRDRLEHEIRNARRSKLPLALLFIDLDGFKDVNDTLGHDMGDLLLKEAADRLYRCVRETDTVARLGGDEFTVILPELQDLENADRVAQHILRALSDPIRLGNDFTYVSGSIGITLYPQDAVEVEDLIKNADQAMYAAKLEGKNQYHYFTQQMQDEAQRRMRLINDLRGALDGKQFEIVYQPIVELSSGSVHKAEALIRWLHPAKGLISPIEFISAAEDTGLIASFGNWVFHEAARQAATWRKKYHPEFQISVNISPVQFKREGIDPFVWLDHLKSLELPGQGIVVEITEGLLLEASTKVQDQLLMLRDAGIEVALDDFGTGYSSLAYLKRFDIDYLKIDQAFVQNLTAHSDDMALCEAIIVMAHKLGLKVIAEGVETDAQRSLLASAGCDFAQGYFFSKPVSVGEFERLVESDPLNPRVQVGDAKVFQRCHHNLSNGVVTLEDQS